MPAGCSGTAAAVFGRIVDYYEVLGVSTSATAAELRQAYRVQALRFHPDKNPERVKEATERFKLIAEAYSVLRDEQMRAQYDRSRCAGSGFAPAADGAFSFSKAKDLFGEMFGEELASSLGRMASLASSTLAEAAGRCSRIPVVQGAVAAGFHAMLSEAHAEVEKWEAAETRCLARLEARRKELREMEAVFATQREVRNRRAKEALRRSLQAALATASGALSGLPVWFIGMAWPAGARFQCHLVAVWLLAFICIAVWCAGRWDEVWRRHVEADQRNARERGELKDLLDEVRSAKGALETAQAGLSRAREVSRHARSDLEEAEADGASIGGAAKIGLHFCGRLLNGGRHSSASRIPEFL